MQRAVGVEARGAQGEEVLGRLGDGLAEDFDLEVAWGRVVLAGGGGLAGVDGEW